MRVAAIVMLAALIAGCSGDDSTSASSTSAASRVTTTTSAAPANVPAFDVADVVRRDIPTGKGVAQSTATGTNTAPVEGGANRRLAPDYVEREYLVGGVASTYTGPATGPPKPVMSGVRYVTRVLVRVPKDGGRFSGRVVIEPLNTSAGTDLDVVWSQAAPLLQSEGDAWVGVTVRRSSDTALKQADPARYASLSISTNDIEWDILRQVGAVVKQGGAQSPLAGLRVRHAYMAGYSQSGLDTATFAMAFSSNTGTSDGVPVFDGYLPAAHSGSVTPLTSGTDVIPTFEHVAMTPVAVPVVDPETQSDVEGFSSGYTSVSGASVRRADSDTANDRYRLYELPGAPHAAKIPSCSGDGSTFPTFFFLEAALSNLFHWSENGVAPKPAERIVLAKEGTVSQAKLDDDGNALGGVRSPFVDVPLSRYAAHSTPGPVCALGGAETPLDAATLRARYRDAATYMQRFEQRLDATIGSGFLLRRDRNEIVRVQEAKAKTALG